MENRQTFVVERPLDRLTAYHFLRRTLEAPAGVIRQLLREGRVLVDGSPEGATLPLTRGSVVEVDWSPALLERARRRERGGTVEILHVDPRRLVVQKPPGVPVVPDRRREHATILDLLPPPLDRDPQTGARPKVVHRLDKHASGALLLARDRAAKVEIGRLFEQRRVRKRYLAVVRGRLGDDEVVIDAPVGPVRRHALRQAVDPKRGKPSLTRVRVARRFRGFTLLEVEPETGRTHQIRVHLAHIGFPLLGDALYGGLPEVYLSEVKPDYRPKRRGHERPLLARLALHCTFLGLPAGPTGPALEVEAPLARDLDVFLFQLERWASLDEAD